MRLREDRGGVVYSNEDFAMPRGSQPGVNLLRAGKRNPAEDGSALAARKQLNQLILKLLTITHSYYIILLRLYFGAVLTSTQALAFRDSRRHRNVVLPTTIDFEKIDAAFAQGVLKITLPKRAERQPQPIKVRVHKEETTAR